MMVLDPIQNQTTWGSETMIYHRSWYPFDAKTIQEHVPATSGVYSLYSHQECAYVGASQDLRAELTRLLTSTPSACLSEHAPDEFLFEVALGDDRHSRRDELINELNPTCRD
jgi:hypothetical protein